MLRPRHPRLPSYPLRKRFPNGGRRINILASLPAVLVPPVVFGGLIVTLWTYKCMMMVLFQNKIIYMPGIPLGARRETLSDYLHLCSNIPWRASHRSLPTTDGFLLSTVTATLPPSRPSATSKHILIVYFQGNASSTPPRLPHLSSVLAALSKDTTATYTILIPSYRGYWTSTGSPSQTGIQRDLAAVFTRVEAEGATDVVLWGQSIGCGIALTGWADALCRGVKVNVVGVLLETPFVSVQRMLKALYPQRWLPYRYLGVFLRSTWDMRDVVGMLGGRGVRVLVVEAGRDEVVPAEETREVERVLGVLGGVRSVVVEGALHGECVARPYGRGEVVKFLKGFGEGGV